MSGGNHLNNIEIHENELSVENFMYIYNSTHWKPFSASQISLSLQNDSYHVSAWINKEIVGMGRLVGDGVMYWYIQNLIVLPKYQLKGVGTAIMNSLLSYIKNNSLKGSHITVGLMCSESVTSFYEKFSFQVRPYDKYGPGATLEFDYF